ncbi:MAG TPA: hypothetical protein VJ787_04050 [Thermoleophilia bacterium]|nr:hypothetical protein [Thermoleophilia bacterium]
MTRDIAIKCPVCLGKCKDEHGQDCKPCGGKGILWGKETDDAPASPVFVPQPYPYPAPWPCPPVPWYQPPAIYTHWVNTCVSPDASVQYS